MEANQNIFSPRHLKLNNRIYTYKDVLINDFFTYRCKYRTKCNVVIKINKDNIKKYIDDPNNEDIEYTYASKNENHKCIEEKGEHEIDAYKKKKKIILKNKILKI